MSSLICEVVFALLFIYFYIITFSAEIFSGVLKSFLCVFGFATFQETTDLSINFPLFYYSYVIVLSILGNIMFLISLIIYGPIWYRTRTQFVEKRQTVEGITEVVSPQNQILYCSRRRFAHICVFTRYDLYATLILFFICAQFVLRGFAGRDDFKQIEGMIFSRTLRHNSSQINCWDKWCDTINGGQALWEIHLMQQRKHCCGWEGAVDWLITSDMKLAHHNLSLPNSCCSGRFANCSLGSDLRFKNGCYEFGLPVRSVIDPTQYSNHCFGLYPFFKLMAVICYQLSFSKIFDGSALLLRVNLFFPLNIRII